MKADLKTCMLRTLAVAIVVAGGLLASLTYPPNRADATVYPDGRVRGTQTTSAVTVAATATQILAANVKRVSCIICNNSSQIVYLGVDANVTTSNGIVLPANSSLSDSSTTGAWFGIVAATTADVRASEVQ